MDKDRVKGAVDDAAGRVKRQVGEWTGNTNAQVEGAAQQVKGKAEKAMGNVKDAVRDASKDFNKNAGSREHSDDRDNNKNRDNNEKVGNYTPQQGQGSEQHQRH